MGSLPWRGFRTWNSNGSGMSSICTSFFFFGVDDFLVGCVARVDEDTMGTLQ